jgi:hypothetical protein
MNFPRVAMAAIAAWVLSLPIGYVVNEIILADVFAANAAALRPHDVIQSNLPLGFGFMLVGFFAFAYAYAKGYEGDNGIMEGVRYGVLVALMLICFVGVWWYATVPIDTTMFAASCIDYVVEFSIYGATVAAIYKPVAVPARV